MIITSIYNDKKLKSIVNCSVDDYSDMIERYLIEIKNSSNVYTITNKFRTTKNAELINIYYNDCLAAQVVKSYNTYVLMVTQSTLTYVGYISNTTIKHILRYFKDYCKFNFTYEDTKK